MRRIIINLFLALTMIWGTTFYIYSDTDETIDALSLDQFFTDGIKREGVVTVAAPIMKLVIERDPFDDFITSATLIIGEQGRSLTVFVDNYSTYPFDRVSEGTLVAIRGEAILMGSTGFIRGDLLSAKIKICEYNKIVIPINNGVRIVTVKGYFDEKLLIGSEQVILQGTVKSRSVADDGSILFVLQDEGREIYSYSEIGVFDIESNKKKLQSYKIGSSISLLGTFFLEGATTIFSFSEIK